jgi:membrane associated rhomboid family serine protease
MLIGLGFTSVMNLIYWRYLPLSVKISGALLGSLGGSIYGILSSTEYSLKKYLFFYQ